MNGTQGPPPCIICHVSHANVHLQSYSVQYIFFLSMLVSFHVHKQGVGHSKGICLVFSTKYGRSKRASRDQGKGYRQSCFFSTPWCELSYCIKVYPQKVMFSENNTNVNQSIFWQKFSPLIKKSRS